MNEKTAENLQHLENDLNIEQGVTDYIKANFTNVVEFISVQYAMSSADLQKVLEDWIAVRNKQHTFNRELLEIVRKAV